MSGGRVLLRIEADFLGEFRGPGFQQLAVSVEARPHTGRTRDEPRRDVNPILSIDDQGTAEAVLHPLGQFAPRFVEREGPLTFADASRSLRQPSAEPVIANPVTPAGGMRRNSRRWGNRYPIVHDNGPPDKIITDRGGEPQRNTNPEMFELFSCVLSLCPLCLRGSFAFRRRRPKLHAHRSADLRTNVPVGLSIPVF